MTKLTGCAAIIYDLAYGLTDKLPNTECTLDTIPYMEFSQAEDWQDVFNKPLDLTNQRHIDFLRLIVTSVAYSYAAPGDPVPTQVILGPNVNGYGYWLESILNRWNGVDCCTPCTCPESTDCCESSTIFLLLSAALIIAIIVERIEAGKSKRGQTHKYKEALALVCAVIFFCLLTFSNTSSGVYLLLIGLVTFAGMTIIQGTHLKDYRPLGRDYNGLIA